MLLRLGVNVMWLMLVLAQSGCSSDEPADTNVGTNSVVPYHDVARTVSEKPSDSIVDAARAEATRHGFTEMRMGEWKRKEGAWEVIVYRVPDSPGVWAFIRVADDGSILKYRGGF
jgi:hypothetical protein